MAANEVDTAANEVDAAAPEPAGDYPELRERMRVQRIREEVASGLIEPARARHAVHAVLHGRAPPQDTTATGSATSSATGSSGGGTRRRSVSPSRSGSPVRPNASPGAIARPTPHVPTQTITP